MTLPKWYDFDRSKPINPGFYTIEDCSNAHHDAYWDGQHWYVKMMTSGVPIWCQSWLEKNNDT